MARTNTPTTPTSGITHEGAPARRITAEQELERSVLSCLLWESEFYEDGESVAERIWERAQEVAPAKVAALAIRARSEFNLRHVPLWLCVALARRGQLRAETLEDVIQRADEMGEFLSLYWKAGRVPLSSQVKKGLALAFPKFDAYQLGKYNRSAAVRLRDVMFLTHPKPKDEEQAATWRQLAEGELAAPDTWEVALSGGADKRETWERLMAEKKLGVMAFLRNLRNMEQAGVSRDTIRDHLGGVVPGRVLPFRFIAAARAAPHLEPDLERLMLLACPEGRLPGRTFLLIDVSGSMTWALSENSKMSRIDAACGLAILCREVCADVEVFTFSQQVVTVPPRRGFALRDAICTSQPNSSTFLGQAVQTMNARAGGDRLIVLTDEQSHDAVPGPAHQGYMINVASAKRGIGYGPWIHIDGFSEAALSFIAASETSSQ